MIPSNNSSTGHIMTCLISVREGLNPQQQGGWGSFWRSNKETPPGSHILGYRPAQEESHD